MSGIRKRNLSIGKLIGAPVASSLPAERAEVIDVGAGTVDVRKGDGFILRRVPLIGSANVRDIVQIEHKGGGVQALASGAGTGGSSSGANVAATGSTPITYTGAPNNASYLTLGADATLTNERVFTKGTGLTATDAGAGGAYTLNVGAGTGILSNANDVAVNTAYSFTWSNPHTFSSGLYIGADVFLSRIGANILALGTGDSFQSQTFTSGVNGWNINYDGSAEFENVRVRGELAASVFKINEMSATAGTLGVWYSAGTLFADFTTPASVSGTGTMQAKNSDAGGMLFGVNDYLQIKSWTGSGVSNSWLRVDSRTNNTTYTSYGVTLMSGSTSAAFKAGTAIADWGPSGSGAITISADGTIGSSPNISQMTHAGSPWSATTLLTRWGKLDGVTDSFFGSLTGQHGIYTNSGWFNNVNIKGSLVIGPGVGFSTTALLHVPFSGPGGTYLKANTNGHLGQPGTLTGPVVMGDGPFFGNTRSLLIQGAATNLAHAIVDSSFESGITGVTQNGASTITSSSAFAFSGTKSLRCQASTNGAGWYINVASQVSNGVTYTWSLYMRGSGTVKIWGWNGSAQLGAKTVTLTSNWTRYATTFNWSAGATQYLVGAEQSGAGTVDFYTDCVQLEANDRATGWTTTARTQNVLSYAATKNINASAGTVACWVYSGNKGGTRTIFSGGTAASLVVYFDDVNITVTRKDTDIAATVARAFVENSWTHYAVTWSGTSVVVYANGENIGTGTAAGAFASPTTIYVGTFGGTSSFVIDSAVSDFFISDNVLTDNQVSALYNSNAPVSISRSGHELLLTDDSGGRVTANAGGIYGTGSTGLPNFTLLNSAQTVNGEAMEEGAIMFGDNSSSKANMRWDNAGGALLIRSGTTTITQIAADGQMTFNIGTPTGTLYNKYAPIGAVNFRRPAPNVRIGEVQGEYTFGASAIVKMNAYQNDASTPVWAIVKAQQDAATGQATGLLMANDGTTANSGFGTLSGTVGVNTDKTATSSQAYLQSYSSANYSKAMVYMDSGGANVDITALHGSEYARIFMNSLSGASKVDIYADIYRFLQGGYMYLGNVAAVPGTPTGGVHIYAEGGALKAKGSSGTITTIAAA